jgi:hypothetical protein
VTGLPLSLLSVEAILLAAAAVGYGVAGAFVPRGPAWRAERISWGFAAGLALVAGSVALSFAFHGSPGWLPFLLLAAIVALPARLLRFRDSRLAPPQPEESAGERRACRILFGILVVGVALYLLRALTEPMWANDFVAIWGFKGKTFFAERHIPDRLFRWQSLSFSHPEYPLGLPMLYAGIAFLLGRWDDHAMALLFPFLQVATLLLLYGWLRRRGAGRPLALAAAALLSQFEPLYRAFTTGMADVPLSFGVLLLGTALADRIERTDRGASRRLALAALVCTATKNEGLYFVAAAFLVAALSLFSRRGFAARAAAVLALPAALVIAAHRLIRGSLPLRDFDFSLLSKPAALIPRIGESLATAVARTPPAAWIGLAALVALVVLGRSSPSGTVLLALAGCGFAAYLFLPALAVKGPAWLIETAFFRTTAALAPLVAAGVAVRLTPVFPSGPGGSSGSERDRATSAASP